jgi:hypothetical protein
MHTGSDLTDLLRFRVELSASFGRRADALFELTDAALTAGLVPSLAYLSLEGVHRRGWGSLYAALDHGTVNADALRDAVARLPLADGEPIYAVDVSVWPRCDAEASPGRGFYYHPSRHSAGQPIVAGWAYSWLAQLGFARDSWTAPLDVRRVHPTRDANQVAVEQIKAFTTRRPAAAGVVPLFVFDAGYDPVELARGLADKAVAILVRLRSDRCFYADPPPTTPGPQGGRPRPSMSPRTSSTGPSASRPGPTCMPRPSPIPATGAVGRARSSGAASSGSRWRACPVGRTSRKSSGSGGPGRASPTSPGSGGPTCAASTWSIPCASASRPSTGPRRARATPTRPIAGPGWWWRPTPRSAWRARTSPTGACPGSALARRAS